MGEGVVTSLNRAACDWSSLHREKKRNRQFAMKLTCEPLERRSGRKAESHMVYRLARRRQHRVEACDFVLTAPCTIDAGRPHDVMEMNQNYDCDVDSRAGSFDFEAS